MTQKLNALKFALAAGIWFGAGFFIATILTLVGVPGFEPFVKILESIYGPYGYSITIGGAFMGAVLGFSEGFIDIGIFALIYSALIKKSKTSQPIEK